MSGVRRAKLKGSSVVPAQVVPCLVCDVPTEGVWGLPAPAGCGAEPCCFFPAWDHASEAGVIPCRFFPFPIPWTKSVGVKCFGVSCIRDFGACKPATWAVTKIQTLSVVRVPRTTEREGKKEAMGAPPPNPLENKKKRNYPGCVVSNMR